MQGHFAPDLKKQLFADMDSTKQGCSDLTNARIKFQRICVFHPHLSFEAKAEKAGLTHDEVCAWWAVAFRGKG